MDCHKHLRAEVVLLPDNTSDCPVCLAEEMEAENAAAEKAYFKTRELGYFREKEELEKKELEEGF